MSRNKYPEETHQKIINVSLKLFMTKGYEKTSLQDIIDELGGFTKGAIYHHFKSKEDILIAVVNHICKDNASMMAQIRDDNTLTGAKKLEKMFDVSLKNPKQSTLFLVTPNLLDNPTFLTYYLKNLLTETIPLYVVPVIKDGVKDHSIQTDYPDELGNIIMFLTDVWLNPLIIPSSTESLINKAYLLNQMMEPFHIRILSEEMIQHLTTFRDIAAKENENKN